MSRLLYNPALGSHVVRSTISYGLLRTVKFVIVDEIHSLVPGKRGTFLALLLERPEEG